MTLLAVVPPAVAFLAVAAAVALTGRRVGHAVAAAASALAVPWLFAVPAGEHVPAGLFGFDVVLFAVDPVSRAVGAVFAFVALANVAYAYGTGASTRQTATSVAYVAASLGAVFAGDWLSLVVWWEAMAVAATVLLWQSRDAVRAGYRYAVYHQIGGAALLAGVLLHYADAGTLAVDAGLTAGLPTALALLGVGLNVGFLGVHVWIPDAYPRPHVASTVFLSGFTTKVGVYALVRVLGGDGAVAVAWLGALMVLVGVTMAVLQTDVRRLLAYHIVSQVGYMVVAVAVGTAAGTAGGVAHLANNVLYKTLLFMVAGVLVLDTGRESLKQMGGLAGRLPVTAGAFAVAAFAITGVPGFAGFVSKGFVTSAVDAADATVLYWALQVGAVGTVVSFAKFGYYAFLRDDPEGEDHGVGGSDGGDATASSGLSTPPVVVALVLLAVPCVAFGLAPDTFAALLPAGATPEKAYATAKVVDAVVILAVGVVAFAVVRVPLKRVTAVPDLDAVYHPLARRTLDATTTAVASVERAADRAGAGATTWAATALADPDALADVGLDRATVGTAVAVLALAAAAVVAVAVLA